MTSSNDFKTGLTIQSEGKLFTIIEFQHVKPGKGPAFVRSKLRDLRSGAVIDKTWRAGEKVATAHIDKHKINKFYSRGDTHVVMDNDTYDQLEIDKSQIEYQLNFIIENMEVTVISFEGEILGVDIPEKVTLKIEQSDPAVKGNTATNATKDAYLETGFKIQVPLFVEQGESIVVNTSTGKYDSRA